MIAASRDRDNFQLKFVSAESALEDARKQAARVQELNQKLTETGNTVELQRHEIVALKVSSLTSDIFRDGTITTVPSNNWSLLFVLLGFNIETQL